METLVCVEADAKQRLDVYLALKLNKNRSAITRLIKEGFVTVNGTQVKAGTIIKVSDIIAYKLLPEPTCNLAPYKCELDIVFEDDYLAVINKPQGMVVHPGNGTGDDTLVNALLYHFNSLSTLNGSVRPGIVHRLDKNTSGLLVIAKNDAVHNDLAKQIAQKTAKRIYQAVVDGNVKKDNFIIDLPVGRSTKNRTKMAVCLSGRQAQTQVQVLQRYKKYSYVECSLKTGRTHQIRVHLSYHHHPVIGDKEYGGTNKFGLNGQLLHACRLEFIHPITNELKCFVAPLPSYFEEVLNTIKKEGVL